MGPIVFVAVLALSSSSPSQSAVLNRPATNTIEAKASAYSVLFDPFAEKKPETPEQEADRARRNTVVISEPKAGIASPSLGEVAREQRDAPCAK